MRHIYAALARPAHLSSERKYGAAIRQGLGRCYQRHQGFLVAATRGFDQPGQSKSAR
jgi:hypothetical protein